MSATMTQTQMLLELEHPRFGPYKAVNNAIKLSRTPAQPHGYSPAPGEHSEEILRELGRFLARLRMIFLEHLAELAYAFALTLLLGELPKLDFGDIAARRVRQEFRVGTVGRQRDLLRRR